MNNNKERQRSDDILLGKKGPQEIKTESRRHFLEDGPSFSNYIEK